MKKYIWDACQISPHLDQEIEKLNSWNSFNNIDHEKGNKPADVESTSSTVEVNQFQFALAEAEVSGRQSLEMLDSLIQLLHQIRSSHDEVTGRTNSLVSKCESLLDQQVIALEIDS
jgi:hypothetical protein